MRTFAMRFSPGQDLKDELDHFIEENRIDAACVLTCVGSLRQANIRFADQSEGTVIGAGGDGHFEIVSLTGMMSFCGSHYHISISDENGSTIGGHLMSGSVIYTTAEIVIGLLEDLRFHREYDEKTGYHELVIRGSET